VINYEIAKNEFSYLYANLSERRTRITKRIAASIELPDTILGTVRRCVHTYAHETSTTDEKRPLGTRIITNEPRINKKTRRKKFKVENCANPVIQKKTPEAYEQKRVFNNGGPIFYGPDEGNECKSAGGRYVIVEEIVRAGGVKSDEEKNHVACSRAPRERRENNSRPARTRSRPVCRRRPGHAIGRDHLKTTRVPRGHRPLNVNRLAWSFGQRRDVSVAGRRNGLGFRRVRTP